MVKKGIHQMLTTDAEVTGVYLREVVAVLPDDVCHGYSITY